MLSIYARLLILVSLAILANCAPKPTAKEMDGKVKGKASLQLADGSTISRDDSDEYNPYLVQLSDGFLVLVFGSDRNGGVHNIFVAKSIEPYNGFEVPAFETPTVVTESFSPIDDANMINFAATASGTSVVLYVNLVSQSGFIRKGVVTDTLSPDVGTFAPITNTNQESNTIIGINADGNDLITLDYNGIAYLVNPDNSTTSNPFGANLDYSTSATQVRYDNSGQNDAYLGSYYGSTFATTGTEYYGPIFDFELSLAESGLSMGQMTTFYDGYGAYGDMILFAAHDGLSADIYVVTSHTAGMLWQLAAPITFDTFLPPAPMPDHLYTFDSACGTDDGIGGLSGSCTSITPTSGSYDGTNYGPFNGSTSNILLNTPTPNLNSAFTIAAWINVPSTACGSACTIAANSATGIDTNGFRFYIDATTQTLIFEIGNGNATEGVSASAASAFTIGAGWHHVAVTVNVFGGAYVYADGLLLGFTMAPMPATPLTNANIYIGQLVGGASYFGGNMDNVAIYEYELDPMSIMALYLE